MVAQQRSGTGALGSLLGSHDEVAFLGEIFHPEDDSNEFNFFRTVAQDLNKSAKFIRGVQVPQLWNEYLDDCRARTGKRVLLVDVKYDSLRALNPSFYAPDAAPYLLPLVGESGSAILWLQRKNAVRTFVSAQIATRSGVWHAEEEPDVPQSLEVDPLLLRGHIDYLARVEAYLASVLTSSGSPVSTLEYADLFSIEGCLQPEAASVLSACLGIPKDELSTLRAQTFKQAGRPLFELIANFDEVAESLAPTPDVWMLVDDGSEA